MWHINQRQSGLERPLSACFPLIRLSEHLLLSASAMPDLVRLLPASLGVCSLAGMALIWRDISSKMKGGSRTVTSLVGQYVALKAAGWLGKRQRGKLEADTLNVKRVQEETLLKRLKKAANTCYAEKYDFSSITGKKTHHNSLTFYDVW